MATPREGLAVRRKALGYSQERLAEILGVTVGTVGRWERGESAPEAWRQPRLAKVLGLSTVEELIDLLHPRDEVPAAESCDVDRLERALANPSEVDLVTVAQLRERVSLLSVRYDGERSTGLLAEAGQALGQTRLLREHARQYRVRRDLLAAEAEASTLMGQFVWDASQRRDHDTAREHFTTAAEAARGINDPVLEAVALLRTSYVELYGTEDPAEGLVLTERAAEVARGHSEVLTGLADLHAAEGHAMLGERLACERSLERAQDHFGRISDDEPVVEMFSETQYGRLAGSCYLRLHDATRAQSTLERVASQAPSRSKSRTIVLANLSLAHLQLQDLENAAAALHVAIDCVEATWGGGGLKVIFGAAQQLRPWRKEPVVDQVYDRLFTMMAAS
ncbi:DNA-binding XRE family transcriptional regulator [Lentzea atacamensis]|uniref:DNA-binding XRE family transcriptional regulator n=1 Tax=Lentzea atacamensis TaxID=531938 RepID=A0ABX9DVA0_9PSEU|nr:helix-turn-helix transcriptional regulator [Lentzea atacamensis]RAS58999.1 DNA-binding XRE family transcriptional regulator [Lentzea atacamensis]